MADHSSLTAPAVGTVDPGLVTYTHVIYALHATSVILGLATSATIIGSFIFGIPSIIGVIMNYVRQSDVRGTYLESHFRWQIRTFWYALLWVIIVAAISAVLLIVVIGIATWFVGLGIVSLWVIYRLARGWL